MHKTFGHFMQRLWREESGVAYIEFALSLPFLLLLFAGSIDVTRLVLLHQKVDKAVFTVGDLATQLDAESGVCAIVAQWETDVVRDMVRPFDWSAGDFSFVMSSVLGAQRNGAPPGAPVEDLIEWRYNVHVTSAIGPYSSPYTNVANLPESIAGLATNERVIVTEMGYRFVPIFPVLSSLSDTNFRKVSYFRSRISTGKEGKGSGVLSGCL